MPLVQFCKQPKSKVRLTVDCVMSVVSISPLQIRGDTFSPGDPSPATDGIISLHPDLPGFGEFRNPSNGKHWPGVFQCF